jgi:hypothetical protein
MQFSIPGAAPFCQVFGLRVFFCILSVVTVVYHHEKSRRYKYLGKHPRDKIKKCDRIKSGKNRVQLMNIMEL